MTTAFDIGAEQALTKLAKRRREDESAKRPVAKDVGLLAGGGVIAAKSRHGIMGTQRVYHGTTADRWKEIRKAGLDPKFGGTGAAAHAGSEKFKGGSKGRVHVTRSKGTARFFADFGKGHTGKKGKIIPINMDYDKYLRMEADPDIIGVNAPKPLQRYLGTRGTEKVTPEEIKGSTATLRAKAKNRLGKLPGYVRKHPGRFGLGLAGLGAGAYLAQKGARNLVERRKSNG
jgi:hypothetical protein